MKRFIGLLSLAIFPTAPALADMAPPPPALYAVSTDGHLVHVERTKPQQGVPQTTIAIFYAYDAAKDAYVRTSQFDLRFVSEYLYLSRGGKYLIAVNKGHWLVGKDIGIRVYSPDGTLLRRWRLEDILKPEEIAAVPKSSATTWWYSGGEMRGDRLVFWGAEPNFPPPDRVRVSYRFTLDPATLSLERQPQ